MSKRECKMIIFDMDGVILDSEPLHEQARQQMFRDKHITMDINFPDPVGKSTSEIWRQILKIYKRTDDPYECEKEQYRLVAEQIRDKHILPSVGLTEVCDWAKAGGMKIALASSSSRKLVDDTLGLLNIRHFFDVTVAGDEIDNKKPSPDCYLKVLEKTGIPAEKAVAVEDSGSGVAAAKAAGIFCYGYINPTSGNQKLQEADDRIASLRELINLLIG